MQNSPLEDRNSQISNQQDLGIEKSSLENSPIAQAGENVNQAGRDINYFISSIQDNLPQDKIEKIRRYEESLRLEFQEKLDKAALLVNDLRACIEERLTDGVPKDDEEILALLDQLQSILGKQTRLQIIREDLVSCKEGAIWLTNKGHDLAQYATDAIFRDKEISELLRQANSNLSPQELKARFFQDIETYIQWIIPYLSVGGGKPKESDFHRDDNILEVFLDLPESAYKRAFKILNYDCVDPDVSHLSIDVAHKIATYFNRSIIDRDLSQDIQVSVNNRLLFLNIKLGRFLFFFLVILIAFMILILK